MRNFEQTKRFLLILLVGVLIYSCSQDEQIAPTTEVQQNENFISLDEASGIASEIEYPLSLNSIKYNHRASGTTNISKEIESITEIPDEKGNTSYYIISYKNSGFVIIAADNRINPVLAFSNSDKFPIDINQYPNGLVEWLAGTKDFITDIREKKKEQSDEIKKLWDIKEINRIINNRSTNNTNKNARTSSRPSYCDDLDEYEKEDYPECQDCQNSYTTVGPLLTTRWGQWGVYNDLAPNLGCGGDGRAPTGCVATAMAQVMNFHEFPNNYSWINMSDSWGTMETARLMRDIGDAVSMDWGCDGSSADTKNETASSFRNDFGYSSATYKDYNYNSDLIKYEINQGRPVILRGGRNTGWWIFGVYSDGHAWVCDGYRKSEICMGNGIIYGYLYLHMNWGWSGSLNGYFSFNNWNPGDNTFNYKRGMVYNIKP